LSFSSPIFEFSPITGWQGLTRTPFFFFPVKGIERDQSDVGLYCKSLQMEQNEIKKISTMRK
jgi:hypothetical protein